MKAFNELDLNFYVPQKYMHILQIGLNSLFSKNHYLLYNAHIHLHSQDLQVKIVSNE